MEEDADYLELFASSVSSHGETAYKCTETLVDNVPKLNPVVTITDPTGYTSGLNTVPYNAPEDVVPVCNAQLGGLSFTMMHGAQVPPMVPKSPTQIVAGPNTQQKIIEYVSNLNQDVTQPHGFSDADRWVNA